MTICIAQIEQASKMLHDAFEKVPKQIEMLKKEVVLCDQETQDLLHLIELSVFNAAEGYRYSRDLQITRKKRRELKNELEGLTRFEETMKVNRPMISQTGILNNHINMHRKNISKRKYEIRVRSDLSERFNKCHINQL